MQSAEIEGGEKALGKQHRSTSALWRVVHLAVQKAAREAREAKESAVASAIHRLSKEAAATLESERAVWEGRVHSAEEAAREAERD